MIQHHPNCEPQPTDDPYYGCTCGAVGGNPRGIFAPPMQGQALGVLDEARRSQYGHLVRMIEPGERPTMITSVHGPAGHLLLPTEHRHRLILDIDHDVKVIPSSTPGHHHLYIDVDMPRPVLEHLLKALAEAGVIEEGYAAASLAQGYTTVRMPGTVKGTPTDDPVTLKVAGMSLDSPANDLLF